MTRRPNDKPWDDQDEQKLQQMQTILPALKLDSKIIQRLKVALVEVDYTKEPEDDETLIEQIEQH